MARVGIRGFSGGGDVVDIESFLLFFDESTNTYYFIMDSDLNILTE
jgi:hypothetical protein